jgi:hypothetical protein
MVVRHSRLQFERCRRSRRALGAKCSVGVAQSLAHHNAMNAAQMAQIVIVGLFLGFLLWFLLE